MSVYFVQPVDGGPVKIGYAVDVDQRLRELQCGSPVLLRVVAVEDGGRDYEAALHRRFAAQRLHGEWFDPAGPLSDHITALRQAPTRVSYRAPHDAILPPNHGRRTPRGGWWGISRRVIEAMDDGRWVTARHVVKRLGIEDQRAASRVWGCLAVLYRTGWVDKRVKEGQAPNLWCLRPEFVAHRAALRNGGRA